MKVVRPLVLGAVVLAGGYAAWHFTRPVHQDAPPPPAVPVSAAAAKQDTAAVYLTTIGNVAALNTVEIRPQVGGVLVDMPVKEGDEVKKGQVLAVIDPRPLKAALDKANAQLVQDQAQLQNAKLDQTRYSALAQRDFASRQQLDTQVSTVNRLQGVVAADQASIEEAQINLDYSVLKSPLDGRVGLRRVDPGNLIQANSTGPGIISVVQETPISVLFNLPETELISVKDALAKGDVPVLADSADGKRVLGTGKLATTNNAVDTNSGTIEMRADFPNEKRTLTSGQYVDVRVQVDTVSGIGVPHSAVQHGQDGLFVFVINPDKTIKRQPVKVAYDNGTTAVLSDGVAAGTNVVTAGASRVGIGTKVAFNEGRNSQAAPKPEQSAER